MIKRVIASPETVALIAQLREQHGDLIFHQSGGCCDGSAPMCFVRDELFLDANDVLLGELEGCPFYMSADQFEYWKHTQLEIDVVDGRGASFSLEIPLGKRFVTRSRMFTVDELDALAKGC